MTNWTAQKTEDLINLYHVEDCLWDSANKNYMDADLRQAALTRLSTKLGGIPIG